MSLEIKGKVILVLDQTSGTSAAGKDWTKQTFVIEEVEGQYPKKIAIDAFNKDIGAEIGDTVKAFINIESREWEGRWFTNIGLWKVEIIERGTMIAPDSIPSSETPAAESGIPEEDSDLPF